MEETNVLEQQLKEQEQALKSSLEALEAGREEPEEDDKPNFVQLKRAQLRSMPVINKSLHLKTITCQKIAAKTVVEVNRSLYVINVSLRLNGLDEAADLIDVQVDRLKEEILREMESDRQMVEKIIVDNGIESRLRYTKPFDVVIQVSTPAAAAYLEMIEQADRLLQLVDRLWMAGYMKDPVRLRKLYEWELRFVKFKNRLLELSNRARRGINHKRNGGGKPEMEAFLWQGADPEEVLREVAKRVEGDPIAGDAGQAGAS